MYTFCHFSLRNELFELSTWNRCNSTPLRHDVPCIRLSGVCVGAGPTIGGRCVFMFSSTFVFFRAYRRRILTFFFPLTRAKFFEILYGKTFFGEKLSRPDRPWLDRPGTCPDPPDDLPRSTSNFPNFSCFPYKKNFFPELLFFPSQERKFSEILLGEKTFFSPKKKEKVRKF